MIHFDSRTHLVLDHFYISLEPNDFLPFIETANFFSRCEHIHVKSSDDAWEGVYLSSKTGAYFEVLNERRLGGLGIAFRSKSQNEWNIRNILKELPLLKWKFGTRSTAKGDPWFDWVSLGDYLDVYKTWFNTWMMHYYPSDKPKDENSSVFSVSRFLALEMIVGRDHLSLIQELSSWFPGGKKFLDDQIVFSLTDRDGSLFEIYLKLKDGADRFQFKRLSFVLEDGSTLENRSFGRIRFHREGIHGAIEQI